MVLKVLGMGDSPFLSTGYGNQSRYLFEHLSNKPNKWDCFFQAWHYNGQPIKGATFKDGEKLNYWVYAGGNHPWGADVLQRYLNDIRPDIFWVTADSFMLIQSQPLGYIDNWISRINFSPTKTIFWFPSDGEPFPRGCEMALKKFDYNVAYSKFAQEQVKKEFGMDVEYIPLMCNTDTFFKMKDKEHLKVKWLRYIHDSNNQPVDILNKKIALCVARNQGRKFLDRIIKLAVEYFKDGKNKDTIMLLKSHPGDPASGGVDLMNLARHYGIADKICWVYTDWFSGFTIHEMREIYNLADVFILPTSGEGWGIPYDEAMATELPILTTSFTTPSEIVDGDERQLVKLATTITGTFDVERGICDIPDFNTKLQALMDDDNLRKEIGKTNRQKVVRNYSSKVVLPRWERFLEKVVFE